MNPPNALARPTQSILGIGYQLILTGAETGGAYELMRFVAPPGIGPPPHIHHREVESFHVLQGEIIVTRGDEQLTLRQGDSIHLPADVPHAFVNQGSDWADFLCWIVPANIEPFFAAFAREWPAEEEFPPPPTDEDIQAMLAAAEIAGIEMLRPG